MNNKDNNIQAPDLFDQMRINQIEEKENVEIIEDVEEANSQNLGAETSTNGRLVADARRVLVRLLKQGVILAANKSKLFDIVCRYENEIRDYLADIYLRLELDKKSGVAFVKQIDETDTQEDGEVVSLISRRTLSLYDTLLLLVLRKFYRERENSGESRIIIDIERIEANLTPFLPLTNSSRSDRRKLSAAVKKMSEKHILTSVRGNDERFEITPIIRYVVNAQFLENLLSEYQKLADEASTDVLGSTSFLENEDKDNIEDKNEYDLLNKGLD